MLNTCNIGSNITTYNIIFPIPILYRFWQQIYWFIFFGLTNRLDHFLLGSDFHNTVTSTTIERHPISTYNNTISSNKWVEIIICLCKERVIQKQFIASCDK